MSQHNDNQPEPTDFTTLPFFQNSVPATSDQPASGLSKAASHLTRAGRKASQTDPLESGSAILPTGYVPAPSAPPAAAEGTALIDVAVADESSGAQGHTAAALPPATDFVHAGTLEERSALPWDDVTEIRGEVSRMLAERLVDEPDLTEKQREAIAREFIDDLIRTRVDSQTRAGQKDAATRWDQRKQQAIRQAVLDGQFRLGRLQPLVDEDGVENIHINGHDDVWLSYSDGTTRRYPFKVAESDNDLTQEINFLATRTGEGARSFTASNPRLHLDLPGGARLAAIAAPVAQRPTVVIRIHRLVDVQLSDLAERGTLTTEAAAFLDAAVRAGVSVVTSGFPGAGKTTLLRALADCIPRDEKIVTIEMERELYLDQLGDRHPRVTSLEYRPGGGEPLADGSLPGEISLEDLVYDTLRLDTQRFVVGEVRGSEIVAMMQAMQSGVGSLSTLHAESADFAIDRLSALMLSRGANTTPVYAYRMIEQNIDLIVQITKFTDRQTGEMRRAITEISEILPGENMNDSRPVTQTIFKYNKHSRQLEVVTLPSPRLAEELAEADYDVAVLQGAS